MHVEDGIDVSVETFVLGSFVSFFRAEVGGRFVDLLSGTRLHLNNISDRFDFSHTEFSLTSLTLEYLDLGGDNNFAVNDGPLYELASLMDLPTDVAPTSWRRWTPG